MDSSFSRTLCPSLSANEGNWQYIPKSRTHTRVLTPDVAPYFDNPLYFKDCCPAQKYDIKSAIRTQAVKPRRVTWATDVDKRIMVWEYSVQNDAGHFYDHHELANPSFYYHAPTSLIPVYENPRMVNPTTKEYTWKTRCSLTVARQRAISLANGDGYENDRWDGKLEKWEGAKATIGDDRRQPLLWGPSGCRIYRDYWSGALGSKLNYYRPDEFEFREDLLQHAVIRPEQNRQAYQYIGDPLSCKEYLQGGVIHRQELRRERDIRDSLADERLEDNCPATSEDISKQDSQTVLTVVDKEKEANKIA